MPLAMQEGYSTAGEEVLNLGFGAGMGLPNMKRSSDEMHIDTSIGVGTTVTMTYLYKDDLIMNKFFHSVYLDSDKCTGCITCLKRCPTQAIRVRDGKAHIINEFCIDCGECIRHCPHHAKHTKRDFIPVLKDYKYTVALPAPSLYSQFNNVKDTNIILTALVLCRL